MKSNQNHKNGLKGEFRKGWMTGWLVFLTCRLCKLKLWIEKVARSKRENKNLWAKQTPLVRVIGWSLPRRVHPQHHVCVTKDNPIQHYGKISSHRMPQVSQRIKCARTGGGVWSLVYGPMKHRSDVVFNLDFYILISSACACLILSLLAGMDTVCDQHFFNLISLYFNSTNQSATDWSSPVHFLCSHWSEHYQLTISRTSYINQSWTDRP